MKTTAIRSNHRSNRGMKTSRKPMMDCTCPIGPETNAVVPGMADYPQPIQWFS